VRRAVCRQQLGYARTVVPDVGEDRALPSKFEVRISYLYLSFYSEVLAALDVLRDLLWHLEIVGRLLVLRLGSRFSVMASLLVSGRVGNLDGQRHVDLQLTRAWLCWTP
jgi:hypothetical protein